MESEARSLWPLCIHIQETGKKCWCPISTLFICRLFYLSLLLLPATTISQYCCHLLLYTTVDGCHVTRMLLYFLHSSPVIVESISHFPSLPLLLYPFSISLPLLPVLCPSFRPLLFSFLTLPLYLSFLSSLSFYLPFFAHPLCPFLFPFFSHIQKLS